MSLSSIASARARRIIGLSASATVVLGVLSASPASAAGTPGFTLTPSSATYSVNGNALVTATYNDGTGTPITGAAVVFAVTSGPSGSGVCTPDTCLTGDDGVLWTLSNFGTPGVDQIHAYVDVNTSGTEDPGEPSADATATFSAGPPTAAPDTFLTSKGVAVTGNVLTNDSGGSGPLTVTTTTLTTSNGGSVSCTESGDCTYTPAASYTGTDSFTYTINDGLTTANGTVTVQVYDNRRILVFGPTGSVSGLAESTPGVTVTTWDEPTWSAKTTADFAAFDAIVFGDEPPCGVNESTWSAAISNRSTWSAAVQGPVVVIGTDPDFHGKDQLVHQAVEFAASGAKTGLYAALSCAYGGANPPVSVPLLADIGSFKAVDSGCSNDAHKVALHSALAGLDDAYLSNWSCSTHEGFTEWPASFAPLAIARMDVYPDGVTPYTASDGTQGLPYILASGATSLGLSLSPTSATANVGDPHVVTATMTDAGGVPQSGKTIRFSVTSGPDSSATGSCTACLTDSLGKVSWTFTNGGTAGLDAIRAFNDLDLDGAFDAGEPQATASVSFTAAANHDPVANADSLTTTTETAADVNVLTNDTDSDGDTLTVTTPSPTSAHGATVSCTSGGVCTYTSAAGYTGEDTFSYSISDGHGGTATATVTVTVNAVSDVNHAPVAVDDTANALVGTPVDIDVLANDSDPDFDPLEITTTTTTGSAGGSVTCTSVSCTYQSAAGATGTETFTYTISDGRGLSDTATVTVTIASCPSLKDALDASTLVTSEQWVACSAIDANAVSTLGPPVLTPVGGSLALLTSGAASIASPPNDSSSAGRANGNSVRGGNDVSILKLALNVPSGNNCLRFDFAFQSDEYPEYVGSAYNDGFLAELDTNTWSIDTSDPLSPITAPANFAVGPDGKIISINSSFFSSGSVVTDTGTQYDGSTPKLTARTPITPGVHNLYLSIFDAGDGILDSAAFIDNLSVSNAASGTCVAGATANTPPVAVADSSSTNEDVALTLSGSVLIGNDTDADSDTLSLESVEATPNTHGTVTLVSGTVTYTPAANYNGTATFNYTVSDGHGGTDIGVVTITVNPVNDAPSAVGDSKSVRQGEVLSFPSSDLTGNDSDVDGDTLTVTGVTPGAATHGVVTLASGTVTYTPTASYSGAATFTYTVSDGHGGTATATVTVTVIPDTAPVAVGESVTVLTDEFVELANVLSNDTDADGDELTVLSTTDPSHGTSACITSGLCWYEPSPGYRGADAFTYLISDGHGKTAVGTVSVVVRMPLHLDLKVAGGTTTRVVYGTAVPLRATLTRLGGGPVSGEPVQLLRRDRGSSSWTSMGTFTTPATGIVSLGTFKPGVHTEFQAVHPETTYTLAASSPVVTSYVIQGLSVSTVRQRLTTKTASVTGTATPAISGAAVYLYKQVGSSWTRIASTTESGTGGFSFTIPADATATTTWYRVVRPTTPTRLGNSYTWQLVTALGPVSIASLSRSGTTLNAETVTLRNLSTAAVNLSGWKIYSTSTGRTFVLPAYSLAAGGAVVVHTGTGVNGAGHLYLRSLTPIWNDSHDTAKLIRNTGVLAWTWVY